MKQIMRIIYDRDFLDTLFLFGIGVSSTGMGVVSFTENFHSTRYLYSDGVWAIHKSLHIRIVVVASLPKKHPTVSWLSFSLTLAHLLSLSGNHFQATMVCCYLAYTNTHEQAISWYFPVGVKIDFLFRFPSSRFLTFIRSNNFAQISPFPTYLDYLHIGPLWHWEP
jgi:hypothetical protein